MWNRNDLISLRLLLLLPVVSASLVATAGEDTKPDFSQMKAIDHANRVYSDGSKNYLVIFENYYRKEVSNYVEVPALAGGFSYVSHQCALDDSENNKITAYVKIDLAQEKWNDVRYAWIVDPGLSSIFPVKPTQVYCFNDAWGI